MLNGAQCHIEVSSSGWRPIHAAAYCGDVNIMRLILDTGTEIGCLDRNNRSPLDIARLVHNKKVADVIIAKMQSYDQVLGVK